MRLVRLAGEEDGESLPVPRLPAILGSSPESDVVVPEAAVRHAVLFRRGDEVVLIDSGSPAGTYLAGRPVEEAVLHDLDVVELGRGGPRLRFHDLGRPATPTLLPVAGRMSETMAFRVARRTSRSFRVAMMVLALAGATLLGLFLLENRRVNRELASLRQELSKGERDRGAFEQRVDMERRRTETERRTLEGSLDGFRQREEELTRKLAEAAATGDMKILKEELGTTRERIATLEVERAAGEHIIREYGSGVCLIQGSYAFYDASGKPLRYAAAGAGTDTDDHDEEAALETEGDGEIHTVEYYGTGFLVDASGLILTNRHVAEPWWNDSTAETLKQQGYAPRFVFFRAFFPKEHEALDVKLVRRSDSTDLAVLRVALGGRRIPVLPLELKAQRTVAGQPVVVVGYPTGLEAILAKTDSGLVKTILADHGTDSERVTEALSLRGLIRPSTTQGHIGDVTGSDIVFDAPTSQGGSGGPVFNKHGQVIAVEYAVLPKFGGNSFGVPIAYAIELLQAARRAKSEG